MTDSGEAYERMIRLRQMGVDVELKTKQAFWETPRNIAILLATAVAIAGWAGFKLGSQPPQPIVIQFQGAPSALPVQPLR